MLNQTVLVGRLVKEPELKETETGKKMAYITLAIPRSFKNSNGEYDTDFVSCVLWNGVAESTTEYCKKGDLVGVKGRVQSTEFEQDGTKKHQIEIVAEKITFLSKNKNDDMEEKNTNEKDTSISM